MNEVDGTKSTSVGWELVGGLPPGEQVWMMAGAAMVGIIIGALLAAMYFRPGLLAMIAQLKSIVLIAAGVGFSVWGILSLSLGEPFTPPFESLVLFRSPAECLAWGSGLLTAGVLYLVFSFVGFRSRS